ncbi:hypothetical protein [Alicyclobacillus ferrooxydans]|uniref:Uncharacterized protein n=1 Tax=Alicyclobacillus ferrooxydans TaxID=471514 RepID=A0A0N8PNQ5_9BACL|nr:hypothetical protein [Alicyclobacillus ferrooxydans]KPV42181.1 hypothetical protein AN477_19285 [Alicyclobacillus ferrooxydans]
MRVPAVAALASCACVVITLGGCGVQPGNRVGVSTGSSGNASSNTTQTSNASNPTQSNPSAKAAGFSNTTSERSSSSQPGNGSSQSVPSQSAGANGASQSGSESGQTSGQGQTTSGTQPGVHAGSPSQTATDLVPISSGGASNLVQARFAANAWNGMGEAALLVTPPNSYGLYGSLLYIVVDGSQSSTGKPQATLVDEHAISASISPDGKWLMVEAMVNEGTVSLPNFQTHLLFESVDGKKRIDLGHVPYVDGDWTGPETYLYTDGSGHLYTVKPGKQPSVSALRLPAGVTINALRVNPQSGLVAMDEVVPDSNGNVLDRHDVIALWDPSTNKLKSLLTASPSNGYILGPWTNDGSALFYWTDPMHSGSMAADGLQLSSINTNGVTQPVATTLTGGSAVLPVSSHQAVLQVGSSRYLFVKKTIEVWNGQKLISLPGQPAGSSSTQVWPTVSPDGRVVAYSVGNTLPMSAGITQTSQWWQQLQLMTVNLSTGQRKVLKTAGSGVVTPVFNGDGSRIAFLDGDTLDVVNANDSGSKQPVFSVTPVDAASYPQWNVSLPIQIADYQP